MSSPCRNTLLCGRNYSAGLTSFAHIYMLMRTIGRILNHTALNRGGHLRAGEREVSKSTSPRCFTDNAFASRCQIQSNECRCSAVQRWSPPAVRLLRLPFITLSSSNSLTDNRRKQEEQSCCHQFQLVQDHSSRGILLSSPSPVRLTLPRRLDLMGLRLVKSEWPLAAL